MQHNKAVLFLILFTLMVLTPIAFLKKWSNPPRQNYKIPVLLLSRVEGKLYRLDLEDYLVGVVAAEMPAEFSLEALKAQAVAARTQAFRRLKRFGGKGTRYYPAADFSDDPNESQAWLSDKSLQKKWGGFWQYRGYHRKIRQAVNETQGLIMVYQNKPIDAVFHSTCGVGTESAKNVWNYNVPYLQSVFCGLDKQSPRYLNQYFFTWSSLAKCLKIPEENIRKIRIAGRTSSNRVSLLTFGPYRISGKDFRQKLNLTSTYFTIEKKLQGINLKVIGYGHGVGMCQYGADGFAKNGWKYWQILRHYYRGISLKRIKY